VTSNGKNLIPNFVKIGHLVQKVKGTHTAWSHMFYFSRWESRQRWWQDKRATWFTNSHNM